MNQPSLPNAQPMPIFQPAIDQWRLPMWMWISAVVIALVSHLMIAIWFIPSDSPRPGALDVGSEGIEVGLGLAGSYMAAASSPKPQAQPKSSESPTPKPADTTPQPQTPSPSTPVNAQAAVKKNITQQPSTPKAMVKPSNVKPPIEQAVTSQNSAAEKTPAPASDAPESANSSAAPIPETLAKASPKTSEDQAHNRAQQKATGRAKDQQSGGKRGDAKHYYSKLMAWLNRHKTYPKQAKKAKQQGVATVRFTIARNGNILFKTLEKSSGVAQLDHAALQLLEDANPVPKLPKKLKKEQLTVVIPIEYSLITQ